MTTHDFISVLHAKEPAPDRTDKLQLYGKFVGDWRSRIIRHAPDGSRSEADGEIHFGWILQGRAVQDVWMIPRLADRAKAMAVAGDWYGTTLRVYDPEIDAWRIWWIDPATNSFRQQVGRARGADIVQEGRTEAGILTRWSFTGIKPDAFHWLGEASGDGGASWQLHVEVLAQRC